MSSSAAAISLRYPAREPAVDRLSSQRRMALLDPLPCVADAIEGFQHRRNALRLQLAAVGQENELRGGRALLHLVGEREQRAHRAGNHAERRLQFPAGLLDALADLLFVLGLEELPLADVFEIHADQIEVFPRRGDRGGHFLFGFGFALRRPASLRRGPSSSSSRC